MASFVSTPFKSPLKVKQSTGPPKRAAATSCKAKLRLKAEVDDDDEAFSQPSSYSNSSKGDGALTISRKRPLELKMNGTSLRKTNLDSFKKGSVAQMTDLAVVKKPSSISVLWKPFRVPYKDPKKRAEVAMINPYSVVLGMRPTFNHRSMFNPLHDPDEEGALVLYRPKKTLTATEKIEMASKLEAALAGKKAAEGGLDEIPEIPVVVDPRLAKVLRPHQVEGVKFLYDCVTGRRVEGAYGCIMADGMGLGKTLQCITLLWTLLKQSPVPRQVLAEKVIITCPSSLVSNWAAELLKWLGPGKVRPIVCDQKKTAMHTANQQLKLDLQKFAGNTRRNCGNDGNIEELGKTHIGLLLCDEGHRLKNGNNMLYLALKNMNCKRRVILSGTPMQNDLSEYFSLFNFANPNFLGTPSEFTRKFETPIILGRDANATEDQRIKGDQQLQLLNSIIGPCIIRRSNDLNCKYLPDKYEHVVFCKLSPVQLRLYEHFLNSKEAKKLLSKEDTLPLTSIMLLKKLANHPDLLDLQKDIPGCEDVLPELLTDTAGSRANRASSRGGSNIRIEWSSKLTLLDRMLSQIKRQTDDKVVLISNYTETLDLFEKLCKLRSYSFLRLDGTMPSKKRMKLVNDFNDPCGTAFLFLLSSKAGGCGINLVGANRLVLFDPDWNPATDQQALARVWRDGQTKTCYIYRLVAAGTIEEKIFQRQSHKQALSACVVDDEKETERHYSKDNLRDLFTNNLSCTTDTHDTFKCRSGCDRPDRPNMSYGDLSTWAHFPAADRMRLADQALKVATANCDILSFVFQFKSKKPEETSD